MTKSAGARAPRIMRDMGTQGLNAEDGVRVEFLVTGDLLKALTKQWSDPVEIQIVATPGVGTGYEMVARLVPRPSADFRVQADRDGQLYLDHHAADCNWDLERDYDQGDWTLMELSKLAREHLERDHDA